MKIIKAWTKKKPALIGIIVLIAVLLWPAIPLRGLDIWLRTMADISYTLVLYPLMALLTGTYVALYMYNREQKTCNVSASTGASASMFGVLLGACPACIPALAVFLPLSLTVTLSYYSWIFIAISIAIMFFLLYKMGGFKHEKI